MDLEIGHGPHLGLRNQMSILTPDFFSRDPVECARELIGCRFAWKGSGGIIVETEAYNAVGDEACHTFFRPSVREFVSRCAPGDAYVYLNYGVHWMFNIVVKGGGHEGFVLLRALEPLEGIEKMRARRGSVKDSQLASGPGKLTQALGINREDHGTAFLAKKNQGIHLGEAEAIATGPRIGITKAADLPWRFGLKGSAFMSKPFL